VSPKKQQLERLPLDFHLSGEATVTWVTAADFPAPRPILRLLTEKPLNGFDVNADLVGHPDAVPSASHRIGLPP
jgi:hypothetical protein